MDSKLVIADAGIGVTAGLIATRLSGPMQTLLYRITLESVKRQEKNVRPGDPTEVAARKLVAATGASLDKRQIASLAPGIHYGLGAVWGPVYGLLRRYSGMTPAGAGLVSGAMMSLIVDESLTPAMGFSAPSRTYPAATHIRGFVGHLLFAAIVATSTELLYRLTRTTPARIP